MSTATYREPVTWQPERPRFRPARLVTAWILAALALMAAAWLVPGASIEGFWGALLVSAIVAALNAVLPPILAALKLPFTLVAGFLLVLLADALMLLAADSITDNAIHLDSFWIALLVALVASAVIVVLEVITGSNDEDTYTIRVIQRLARRSSRLVSWPSSLASRA